MSKIFTFFGFKNGKLVSVLQSVNQDPQKAIDCAYIVTEPQQSEEQIERWKRALDC